MDRMTSIFEKAVLIDADMHLTQEQKNIKLASLMTTMERRYKIPMFKDEQWERENAQVIRVYREISKMRKI